MLDYKTVPIYGDISRNDVRVLIELCTGKNVIEFGVGGSTLILAQVASKLTSYDTSQEWIDKTKKKLITKPSVKTCEPEFIHNPEIPNDIPECDVLFLDGEGYQRTGWLKHFPKCKVVISHDCRGETTDGPTAYHLIYPLFKNFELLQYVSRIEYAYLDSNMFVYYRREKPIVYENWNITETDNRFDPYIDD